MNKKEIKQIKTTIALLKDKAHIIYQGSLRRDSQRYLYNQYMSAVLALASILVVVERRDK